ncbi:glutamate--cysteine ligase [Streptomyces sp. PmtG]
MAESTAELGERVSTEITRYQVEGRTDPHTDLAALARQLHSTRGSIVRAAARQGLQVISSGTPVLGHPVPPPFTNGSRYTKSLARFRALDYEQSTCACHIHVGVPDLATALRVSNHLRPWLPALVAMGANSPYWFGHDTGYASWRSVIWERWPVSGPPPYFESQGHFEDLVGDLITTGTLLDRGGVYWGIRPSHHVPTVEVRVADAASTVADTVLLAGVIRALASTALGDIAAGLPPDRPQPELLGAACWRAARDGLSGAGIDLSTRRLAPAASQVARLLTRVRPALEGHGDLAAVSAAWARLQATGDGAERQRAAFRRRGNPLDVVDHLASCARGSGDPAD